MRVGIVFQVAIRVASSVLSIIWTPLLLGALGRGTYGTFLSFQAIMGLGGLGDFGLGGAVGIRTGQYLGAGDHGALQKFLALARSVFGTLAVLFTLAFFVLAPFLPHWLGFTESPSTGSLTALFMVGGLFAGITIISSLVSNLNYAVMNLNWLAVPSFIFGQIAIAIQLCLALLHGPLWLLFAVHTFLIASLTLVSWKALRKTHPEIAVFYPVRFNYSETKELFGTSVWVYLAGIGSFVYTTTDRLLINAGFGAEVVPLYQLNNKLCELALFAIANLAFVSMPKFTLLHSASSEEDRQRAKTDAERLNLFETVLGLMAAIVYIFSNERFMERWLGASMSAPPAWQSVFAASLAVTVGANTTIQLNYRIDKKGPRIIGIILGATALFNFAASFAAMRLGSIWGIAMATLIAQSFMSLTASYYLTRQMRLSWIRWVVRSWLIPAAATGICAAIRWKFELSMAWQIVFALLVALLAARFAGLSLSILRQEAHIWLNFLKPIGHK